MEHSFTSLLERLRSQFRLETPPIYTHDDHFIKSCLILVTLIQKKVQIKVRSTCVFPFSVFLLATQTLPTNLSLSPAGNNLSERRLVWVQMRNDQRRHSKYVGKSKKKKSIQTMRQYIWKYFHHVFTVTYWWPTGKQGSVCATRTCSWNICGTMWCKERQ